MWVGPLKERLLVFAIVSLFLFSSYPFFLPERDSSQNILDCECAVLQSGETRADPNLVAQWNMDEGTGNSVGDSSGNGNHGTLNIGGGDNVNSKWIDGVKGTALDLDGVDDYVAIPNSDSLDIINAITLSAWIKPGTSQITTSSMIEKRYSFGLLYTKANKIYFRLTNDSDLQDLISSRLKTDGWYHIAGTFDGNTQILYINGIQIDSRPFDRIKRTTNRINIGIVVWGGCFKGLIDEVAIYKRALTANEIKHHYESIIEENHLEQEEFGGRWFDEFDDETGIERNENISVQGGSVEVDQGAISREGCVGYWSFDERSGNTAHDSSGNGKDGTLNNMNNDDWVNGIRGKALEFDGNDDFIAFSDDSYLPSGGDDRTILMWVKVESFVLGSRLLSYGRWSTDNAFDIDTANGNKFGLVGHTNNYCTSNGYNTNTWYHIVFRLNNNDLSIYINGILDVSHASSSINTIINGPWRIGCSLANRDDVVTFKGIIDEVAIYNRALTETEIATHYVTYASPSVATWHFDEGSGNTVLDSSGNGNHGILRNMRDNPWVNGKIGKTLDFDGADDHVDFGNDAGLDISNAISIEAWIKRDIMGSRHSIVENYNWGDGQANAYAGYGLRINPQDNLKFLIINGASSSSHQSSVSTGKINNGVWYHVVGTYDGNIINTYINGIQDGSAIWIGGIGDSNSNLLVGASGGSHIYNFDGLIDEVRVYNRVLAPIEIRNHFVFNYDTFGNYYHNGTIRSKNITLQEKMTWDSFSANRSVPDNTYLNLSIHDAITDALLIQNTGDSDEVFLDLSSIDAEEHKTIYLKADFRSNITHTPALGNWSVNWSLGENVFESPILLQSLPLVVYVTEDTPVPDLLDLSEYFLDAYSGIAPSSFAVEYNSDAGNVALGFSGSNLAVISLVENWTYHVSVVVNCTNVHDQSTSSNPFNISVIPVNDLPAWHSIPPPLIIDEDVSFTSDYSLNDYIIDAEDNELEFSLMSLEDNIQVRLEPGNNISIIPSPDHFGESYVVVSVREKENHSQQANNITIPIIVNSVNDPPRAELVSPGNNSTSIVNKITLSWKGSDIETNVENLTYDLFFGVDPDPKIFSSDLHANNITVEGLSDGIRYYWYVLPNDGDNWGICTNGIWSFSIDSNIVLPEIILGHPSDNYIVNTTSVNVTWSISNYLGDNSTAHLYMGKSKDYMVELHVTNNLSYRLWDIADNTTYFWKIVMDLVGIEGAIESEIRSFTVKMDFEANHGLIMQFNADLAEVVRGDFIMVNLIIKNVGNVAEEISFEIVGDLKGSVSKHDGIHLGTDEERTLDIKVFGESKLEFRTYNLTIKGIYSGKETSASIDIKVVKQIGSTSRNEGSESLLWFIIAAVLFLIFVGILIFVIHKRKKVKEKTEGEVLDVDMESTPSAGITNLDLQRLSLGGIPGAVQPIQSHFREIPLQYNMPGQNEAYQHKPLLPATRITLPQLKAARDVGEPLKALPQSSVVPAAGVVPTATVPLPTLPVSPPVAPLMPSVTVASVTTRSLPQSVPPPLPPASPTPTVAPTIPPVKIPPPAPLSPEETGMELPHDSVKNASVFRIDEPMPCSICFGEISGGLQASRCSCGNISHLSCGIKVGKCPVCRVDYQSMMDALSEDEIVRSVEDSQRSGNIEIEDKVETTDKDDLLRQLLTQVMKKEITIEEYQLLSRDLKKSF